MKQIGMCIAIALALSGIVMAMIWGGPISAAGAAIGGITIGTIGSWEAYARDRKVRRLVVVAYEAGVHQKDLSALAEVLGTPDVLTARSEALSREATVLAQRYANGDASDY